MNMIINPININTNSYKTRYSKAQNINFGQQLNISWKDIYDYKNPAVNSKIISEQVHIGDLASAIDTIEKSQNNYNPNVYNEKDKQYLLPEVCFPRSIRAIIHQITSQKYRNYRSILIDKITSHKDFDPNIVIPNQKPLILQAIESSDAELLMHLCERVDLEDPFDDDFKTLTDMTKNNNLLSHHIRKAILIQNALNTQEEEDEDEDDGLYEEDEVREYRAEIPESIPSSIETVGGLNKAKQAIEDFIIKPWSTAIKQQLHDNNISMPNGFLMYGPPGCGKTYIAKVIAKQTGFPMYEVDLSNVGSSMGYKTSNTLREIFTALESQYRKNNIPNILFLDEIDSIAASREDTNTDWKRDDINTLISLLNNASEKGIIVIGATNLIDNVDKAILRTGRFDRKIEIELPTEEERKDILEKLIGMRKIALDLLPQVDKLSQMTEGKTCSDISAIVNDCCRQAIYKKKRKVTLKDFENSVTTIEENGKKERAKIGF